LVLPLFSPKSYVRKGVESEVTGEARD